MKKSMKCQQCGGKCEKGVVPVATIRDMDFIPASDIPKHRVFLHRLYGVFNLSRWSRVQGKWVTAVRCSQCKIVQLDYGAVVDWKTISTGAPEASGRRESKR